MPTPRRPVPPSEWTDPRHRRGLAGERAAMAYLTACGWNVEAHRFRVGRQEIDLVVRRGSLVAFVEVKTRSSDLHGAPMEAVGWEKRRAITRVATVWTLRHGRTGDIYRFDVVSVQPGGSGGAAVEHLEDAWRGTRGM